MNYFEIHPHRFDEAAIAAWEKDIAEAGYAAGLDKILAHCGADFVAKFNSTYQWLCYLPRSARRSLQRQLARSQEMRELIEASLQRHSAIQVQQKLASSLIGAALLVTLAQEISEAATITVTTNVPSIAAEGRCSLVEAIINANDDVATHSDCPAGNGADVIQLPPKSTHVFRSTFGNYQGATALPLITSSITIEGNGGKISRATGKQLARLIAVTNSGDLTLNNLTVSGGFQYSGGGIFNAGDLTVSSSIVSGNKAIAGAGIYNTATGSLTIESSKLTKNLAVYGGALANTQGAITIQNSEIIGNKAGYGGGCFQQLGTLNIQNSSISGNRGVYFGGGFSIEGGTVTIQNSVISKNRGYVGGAQYVSGGSHSIENTTISQNTSAESGGAMWVTTGAVLEIKQSTIAKNRTRESGGGLFLQNSGGSVLVQNSTVSGNKAKRGGGIDQSSGNLVVENSTITGNSANLGGGI
jgi:hypothetical protein